jgi:hypothetical protein
MELIIGFDHVVSSRDESVVYVSAIVNGVQYEIETRAWHNTLVHDQGGKEAFGYFQRAGLDAMGVDFSKTKKTLMITMKNAMQQNLFKFSDEKLAAQLGHYKFQESETTKGRYRSGQTGVSDDRVDAAYRAYMMRGYAGESSIAFVGDQIRLSETSGTEFM